MAGHFLLSPAARDFPLAKIEKMSEAEVHSFFTEIRWGKDGTQVCPLCGTNDKHYWNAKRKQWRCKSVGCGHSFSVTSATKFADHKLPLRTLLKAIVIFATNVKGISASALGRQLGVAYMTAYTLLHKLREGILENANTQPLDGLVHVDGAHLSGRFRKPRVKEKATKTQARDKVPADANPYHPNRRIVMVMRSVDTTGGLGAIRSIVQIVPAENQLFANHLAKSFIKKGATVMTDESPAYSLYMARYQHATVNHSVEFSTDDGVNNNIAESFFSRMRRLVIGQVHRVTPKYMLDYMTEVSWREDSRRTSTALMVRDLLGKTQKTRSRWWRGYWQGYKRADEILFVPAHGESTWAKNAAESTQ